MVKITLAAPTASILAQSLKVKTPLDPPSMMTSRLNLPGAALMTAAAVRLSA
jgi:hypothetical protein